jgi:hypothetical protein
MYVDAPDESIQHPIYYYFRRVRPWTRQETPSAGAFYRHIDDSTRWGPVLVRDSRYDKYLLEGHEPLPSRSVAVVQLLDYRLLLPGPYTSCASLPNGDGPR